MLQALLLVHVEIVVEELHAGSGASSGLLIVQLTGVLGKPPDIGRLQEFPGGGGGVRADIRGGGIDFGLLAAVIILTDAQVAQEIGEDVVAAGRCPLASR